MTDRKAPQILTNPTAGPPRTFVGVAIEPPETAREVLLPPGYADRGHLGQGGMGEVRLVWDEAMEREVALKVLSAEHAQNREIVRRFENESRTMARLDHPSIVAVHARGRLPDGRPWYAMRLVRGDTLRELFSRPSPNLRQLLGLLEAVARGVAYAHDQRIVHCDLKPENLLIGPFGEVQVLDWGIAERIGSADPQGYGTPPYQAPEQQPGGYVAPGTDVHALGQMLEEVQTACGTDLLDALVDRSRSFVAASRPSALEFAETIRITLAGEADRERGLAALAAAEAVRREGEEHEHAAEHHRKVGEAMLGALPEDAEPEDKHDAWAELDNAKARVASAELAWTRWLRKVHGALQNSPGLPEAHDLLAEYHHRRARAARERGDSLDEVRHRELVASYDRGRFARYLQRRSALTLHTDPEGVRVTAARFELRHRKLVPVPIGELGHTPIVEAEVPSGSLLLTLHGPEGRTFDVPAYVESGETWMTVAPGASEPWRHRLPLDLAPDECWMPAGWFVSGGDPDAADSIRRRDLFVADRRVRRFAVTNREYLTFLDDLLEAGREEEAWAMAPGAPDDGGGVRYAVRLGRAGFVLEGWRDTAPWHLDWPVTAIPWGAARAYARWLGEREGVPWRLPHDQEIEKATRGVDGRPYPWGDHFEAAWARVRSSAGHPPQRASVRSYPDDCSVYGVRGVAGNARVWCANRYERDGPPPGSAVEVEVDDEPGRRFVRGGAWLSEDRPARAAGRFAGLPAQRYPTVGIRLIRS